MHGSPLESAVAALKQNDSQPAFYISPQMRSLRDKLIAKSNDFAQRCNIKLNLYEKRFPAEFLQFKQLSQDTKIDMGDLYQYYLHCVDKEKRRPELVQARLLMYYKPCCQIF